MKTLTLLCAAGVVAISATAALASSKGQESREYRVSNETHARYNNEVRHRDNDRDRMGLREERREIKWKKSATHKEWRERNEHSRRFERHND